MSEMTQLLVDLFVLFLAAKLAAEGCARIGQPAVLGELLAGVLIGPFGLGLVGRSGPGLLAAVGGDASAAQEVVSLVYHLLPELGVLVLLFFVGLQNRVADLLRVGGRAALVAVLGVAVPFLLGLSLMDALLGYPRLEAVFVSAALVATSVGITARVLRDLGVIGSTEARIILGAAVIDDLLAMLILAVVTGLASTGTLDVGGLAVLVGQALAFTAVLAVAGTWAMRRYGRGLARLRSDGAAFAVAMGVMLGLAALSASIGLAAIIGAFLAGMVLAEAREHFELERQALPVYQLLVPFFFVITGTQVDWRLFLDPALMGLALGLTALAVVGKLIGGGLGVLGHGARSMAIVGFGMVPRGEVGLIVASLGLRLGAIPSQAFSVVVVMSILTTLVVPPILRALYTARPPGGLRGLVGGCGAGPRPGCRYRGRPHTHSVVRTG